MSEFLYMQHPNLHSYRANPRDRAPRSSVDTLSPLRSRVYPETGRLPSFASLFGGQISSSAHRSTDCESSDLTYLPRRDQSYRDSSVRLPSLVKNNIYTFSPISLPRISGLLSSVSPPSRPIPSSLPRESLSTHASSSRQRRDPRPIPPNLPVGESNGGQRSRRNEGRAGKKATACQECHRRKQRCSREAVCRHCREREVDCIYPPHQSASGATYHAFRQALHAKAMALIPPTPHAPPPSAPPFSSVPPVYQVYSPPRYNDGRREQ